MMAVISQELGCFLETGTTLPPPYSHLGSGRAQGGEVESAPSFSRVQGRSDEVPSQQHWPGVSGRMPVPPGTTVW